MRPHPERAGALDAAGSVQAAKFQMTVGCAPTAWISPNLGDAILKNNVASKLKIFLLWVSQFLYLKSVIALKPFLLVSSKSTEVSELAVDAIKVSSEAGKRSVS